MRRITITGLFDETEPPDEVDLMNVLMHEGVSEIDVTYSDEDEDEQPDGIERPKKEKRAMSIFSGRQEKGAMAQHRAKKREEAEIRQATFDTMVREQAQLNPDATDKENRANVAKQRASECEWHRTHDSAGELLRRIFGGGEGAAPVPA